MVCLLLLLLFCLFVITVNYLFILGVYVCVCILCSFFYL